VLRRGLRGSVPVPADCGSPPETSRQQQATRRNFESTDWAVKSKLRTCLKHTFWAHSHLSPTGSAPSRTGPVSGVPKTDVFGTDVWPPICNHTGYPLRVPIRVPGSLSSVRHARLSRHCTRTLGPRCAPRGETASPAGPRGAGAAGRATSLAEHFATHWGETGGTPASTDG
jgi:hypothetical protein